MSVNNRNNFILLHTLKYRLEVYDIDEADSEKEDETPGVAIDIPLVATILIDTDGYKIAKTDYAFFAIYPDNTYIPADTLGQLIAQASADHPVVRTIARHVESYEPPIRLAILLAQADKVEDTVYKSPADLVHEIASKVKPVEECPCAVLPDEDIILTRPIPLTIFESIYPTNGKVWLCEDLEPAIKIGDKCYTLRLNRVYMPVW